jgi:CubicO group peptidase (beta-lactamase class C family)
VCCRKHSRPGEAVECTDRAALILDCLAEHLPRQRLYQLATERTWQPLGMHTARYGPLSSEIAARCAPTELGQDTDTHLKGIAHDFSAPATPAAAGMSAPTPFPKQLDQDLRLPCLSGLARFRGAVFEDPEFG